MDRHSSAKRSFGLNLVVAVSLLHFGLALLVSERPIASYFTLYWIIEVLAFFAVPLALWVTVKFIEAARRKEASPIAYIRTALSADRERFHTAVILLGCYALVSRAYRAIKVGIPRFEEFWADPMFIEWDRAIFGTDPWTITHQFIGLDGTRFLDFVYATWFMVILLAYGFSAFSSDRTFQLRSCFTYLLIWIVLGNGLATLWSSVGPVYYQHFFDSDLFVPLMERLHEQKLNALNIQAYLLSTSGDESIGSGISAMPSIHCAMTMFIVLIVWERRGFGPIFLAAVAYHFLILIGSVHLAWHYAVDGMVSSALVPILWFAVKAIVRPYAN